MKIIDRTGEQKTLKCGSVAKIIEYFSAKNITVQYDDGTIVYKLSYINFKLGRLKNYNKPYLYGVGYFGYGIYKYNDETKKAYNVWRKMMYRCYCEFAKNKRTYIDCYVCHDWHNFQNFAKWYCENYIDGFELDKDILFKGNKCYSANTCCFVPQEINKILTLNNINRGNCVLGVSKRNNKFVAQINIDGIPKDLGHYNNEEKAFYVYKEAKENQIKNKANIYKSKITEECYNSLINWKIEITD
jgi:hypothetical protein